MSHISTMQWHQKEIRLTPRSRGFHLITDELVSQLPELNEFEIGLAHFFILHTSAAISINENASPDVRGDMERYFNRAVPEDEPYYQHTMEGSDDMPAHIKASLLGFDVTVPITRGALRLGTWQGIYLCEHRNRGGARRLMATLHGQPR